MSAKTQYKADQNIWEGGESIVQYGMLDTMFMIVPHDVQNVQTITSNDVHILPCFCSIQNSQANISVALE